MSIIYF
jgi:Ca2+-binding EF-hand superfamily protein